jgi:glycosyltransferase involved in cell wall biosynthesis
MPTPRISIVIVACNSGAFLAETLASVRAQSFEDFECVVIDDGSSDRTRQISEEFARGDRRFRPRTIPHEGTVAARNIGFSMTNPGSAYICFMDGDDLWTPSALQTLYDQAESRPEASGTYGLARCIDENGNPLDDEAWLNNGRGRFYCDKWGNWQLMDPSEPTDFRSLWYSAPFPPGLILARRGAYAKAGPFDDLISLFEDWDMLLRLGRIGDLYHSESAILYCRRNAADLVERPTAANLARMRALQYKTFFSSQNNAEHRRILRHNWRATQWLHARQKWAAAVSHISEGRFLEGVRRCASTCIQFYRLARGYPTLRGI